MNGRQVQSFQNTDNMSGIDMCAATIAKLGREGWEMVGAGSVDERTNHFLYFKRPQE
jgi:hypothetical protein